MLLIQTLKISKGVTHLRKKQYHFFCKLSNSETQTCGFFEDPSDSKYGASPDALAASSIILEVKTRPAKTEGSLTSLKQLPSY